MHRIALAAALAFAALTIAACEMPESPEWDVVVAAPFTSDRLEIDDFLPAQIGATGATKVSRQATARTVWPWQLTLDHAHGPQIAARSGQPEHSGENL